jgi:geranylgeranyl pyrophosphate synthase/predicted secreted hydrolase
VSRHPEDWPVAGAIDLQLHDRPHRSSATEWWYLNTHLATADGRRVSLFAAFFRIIKGKNERTKLPEYAHSVTWAISDPDARTYFAESRVDKSAPELGLERIKQGRGSRDPRLNRAITELLERGRVPRPDRIFEREPFIAEGRLELDFDGNRFEKRDDGKYDLTLHGERAAARLTFTLEKPPHRHGDDGVVRGLEGEDMFYYFIPRCSVTGTVTLDGLARPASGPGWYDHEFGGHRPQAAAATTAAAAAAADKAATPGAKPEQEERVDIAWNWVAAQLDNGVDVTAYALQRVADGKVLHNWAIVSDAAGRQTSYHDMTLTPVRGWRSTRTFYDYPTQWSLSIPAAKIDLTVDASFDDQEFITCISKPAFWEGRVDVRGTEAGRDVTGLGYVERSGFEPIKDLDQFFHAVGQEVRRSVANVLPTEPTFEHARDLIACDERPHYLDGVDTQQLGRALIAPIREITDRGGKSWRSYAALACCDVVLGDSRKYVQWLAMPELLHVGSLIVDDVQDRSTVRRGGPTCHVVHGEAKAINSGTAAYFLTQKLLFSDEISPARKLRLYDLYFEAMRAGHAGQALDLDGMYPALDAAVESGDGLALEKRILAIHRLKAGVPAAALARMGAVVGGGTEAQIEAVGDFFENLGLAFQIVDDVLNLRGFKGDLKSRGEDIANGTVTLPMAKAMSLLDRDERRRLAETLKSKPQDARIVAGVVERLETCGAIRACSTQANEIVDASWARAEPALPDTIPKVMLRAFGWYALERHY